MDDTLFIFSLGNNKITPKAFSPLLYIYLSVGSLDKRKIKIIMLCSYSLSIYTLTFHRYSKG